MDRCYKCQKETANKEKSDNGREPQVYCDECGGFPNHEYETTCPNCNLDIMVN